MSLEPYILVGLGNPGTQYSGTRHNIGFDVIDALAAKNTTEVRSQKWDGLTAGITLAGAAVHLLKPLTFMNLSGKSVAKYMNFYKVPPQRLLVVHDDLDMKTGRLKLVRGGGAGGHNGIRSIVACTGNNSFYRLKIGIGRPASDDVHAGIPVDRYVLTPFAAHERQIIEERMVEIVRGIETFVQGEVPRCINFINSFK
ncbi:MAG: aminoacyl-tRNA hydrolase [Desulfopila sp.]